MRFVDITPFQLVKGFEHMEGLSPEDARQKADSLVAAAKMYDSYGRSLPQSASAGSEGAGVESEGEDSPEDSPEE